MKIEITDPITGEKLSHLATREEQNEFNETYKLHCDHTRVTSRVRIANGSLQLREFCTKCGEGFGSAMKITGESENFPIYEIEPIRANWEYKRFLIQKEILLKLITKDKKETAEFHKQWGVYLRSNKWREKRKKVLARANYVCEGCGEREAEEVHHLTYVRRFTEMLFDLVALCPTCHSLIHFEKNETLRPASFDFNEKIWCSFCRFRSDDPPNMSCGIFDAPGIMAFRSPDMCNNGKNGFEGLK